MHLFEHLVLKASVIMREQSRAMAVWRRRSRDGARSTEGTWLRSGVIAVLILLTACGEHNDNPTALESPPLVGGGDFPLVYVRRAGHAIGNPTDGVTFIPGGDLFFRNLASPSATEHNVTAIYTQGAGDVSDPEASFDGRTVIFSMRGPNDPTWDIWEFDVTTRLLRRLIADPDVAARGDDVDPAYLPDGRIIFSSNRQETARARLRSASIDDFIYLDEAQHESALVLHVMNSDGTAITQLSSGQSHERNPTVLATGEIMFARWDQAGPRNQYSIYVINPDGSVLDILYGAHSPGNSFLQPREMADGRLITALMPLAGTHEGGAVALIDIRNHAENGDNPAQGFGQTQATFKPVALDTRVNTTGRYTTPYPLWDGTARVLVSWSPSLAQAAFDPLTGAPFEIEGEPSYGIYLLNLDDKSLRPVVLGGAGIAITDPIPLFPRAKPNLIEPKSRDPQLIASNKGIINVKSVYDTDQFGYIAQPFLAPGESIPTVPAPAGDPRLQIADLTRLKNPFETPAAQRPARFVRVSKAVPTPPGLTRQFLGTTGFEMQQLLGYAEIEPDGSFKIEVPADTPLAIAVLDSEGRAFAPHTSWLQVRPGETRTCNGCHNPRRTAPLNVAPITGNHADLFGANAGDRIHVHPGVTAEGVLRALDPEGDPLTYRIIDAPSQGTVVITNATSGSFTYTARPDAAIGADVFTWRANDGKSDSNTAIMTVNIHEPPSANAGESMAETRVRYFAETAVLNPDIEYQDVWGARSNTCIFIRYARNRLCTPDADPVQDLTTPAPSDGIINYPDHIQPLWTKDRGVGTCTQCHNNSDPGNPLSVGLDLSAATGPLGYHVSYELLTLGRVEYSDTGAAKTLIVDEQPRLQRTPALITPGASRSSFLIEKLYEQELTAERALTMTVDHRGFLNRAERRLIVEWIDLGAQYYNDPFGPDSNGNGIRNVDEVRGQVSGLDPVVFRDAVHPILMARCGLCHRPTGPQDPAQPSPLPPVNQFILSGQAGRDFNSVRAVLTDISDPSNSALLKRPASDGSPGQPPHPVVTSATDPARRGPVLNPTQPLDGTVADDYQKILAWISARQL